MQPYIIAPSILSANLACLGQEVDAVLAAGADWIHLDVMDNHYVPNLTFGPMICQALRDHGVTAPIDVHLMVRPVDKLIVDFAKAGASMISFHVEASDHIERSLQLIHDQGAEAGIVFNPATPLDCLPHIAHQLDYILLMSVNPGFGGQKYISAVDQKIVAVRKFIDEQSDRKIRLEIDGGVTEQNIGKLAKLGVDTFVAGSAIYKAPDYNQVISNMRKELEG